MSRLLIGFLVGCLFLLFFFVIGGAGHGLLWPIDLVAAPLSIVPAGVIFFPLLTAALAWCAKKSPAVIFLPLLTIHYVSAAVIAWHEYQEESGDPFAPYYENVDRLKWWLISMAFLYLLGHLFLWRTFILRRHNQKL